MSQSLGIRLVTGFVLLGIVFGTVISVFAGVSIIKDYNPWDVTITDNCTSCSSDLLLSGAINDPRITKVKTYFEIDHPRWSDLTVWITFYDNGWKDHILYNQGQLSGSGLLTRTVDNIYTWNGLSPNQTWYLSVRDCVSGYSGSILFFELWVTYDYNESPNSPINPVPNNGATNVSRTTDLDWSCSDPNGDTLSYTVYFEKNDSSPDVAIKTNATGSYADPGTLDYDSHYYWQVVADDHRGGVAWGPIWHFYTEPVPVIDAAITSTSFDMSQVKKGQETITATIFLQNTGNQTWTFYVGGSSIKSGDTIWYDWEPPRASRTLNPGQTGSVNLSWSPPWDAAAGSYGFFCKVFKDESGSDFVDENWQDLAFSVIEPTLNIGGRLIYHSYSGYLAQPVDSIDGNIFLYSFYDSSLINITESLSVENAMNPHFSPDGSQITFMALPFGAQTDWTLLEIYTYDLAKKSLSRLTNNTIPDEDPKFSPDGKNIVFKRNKQIWVMNVDGSGAEQITSSTDEKSGPNYSPDGSRIVYWSNAGSNADIWWISRDGTGASKLIGLAGLQEYYPIFRNSDKIFYTRWESTGDQHDKIWEYTISSGLSEKLPINVTGVEDADPFPVNSSLIGFSSSRIGGDGKRDIYIGELSSGYVYTLSSINSVHDDLGGWYSPYRFARKIETVSPASGSLLDIAQSFLLKVRAYSDGGIWAGATPVVEFQGPSINTYSGLRDDGLLGDEVAGDGIYSKTVTLPSLPGVYSVTVTAISNDNGFQNQLASTPITVTLYDNQPTACFSAIPNPAACGQTISFDGSCSSHSRPDRSIVQYEWDFDGDGTYDLSSASPTTTHSYATFGTFTAALRVTDDNSPPKTDVATVVIDVNQGNQKPIADAGGPYGIDIGNDLVLNGSGSSDPDAGCGDSIVSYTWDLDNDGQYDDATDAAPTVAWATLNSLGLSSTGSYPIGLRVEDIFGAAGMATATLTIYDNQPVACFSAIPNPAACGQTISFDGSCSFHSSPDRSIVQYEWDWNNDGIYDESSVSPTTTHTFDTFAMCTITLRVTDDNYPVKTDITTLELATADNSPLADAGGPYHVEINSGLTLDGSGSIDPDGDCGDSIVSYRWDLNGDEVFDEVLSPTASLTWGELESLICGGTCGDGQSYPIALEAEDSLGVVGRASTYVLVGTGITPQGFDWSAGDNGCGAFEQQIEKNAIVEVGSIPDGLSNVSIRLICDTDVDIQLYDQATGEKIIGWPDGLVSASTETSYVYSGMTIVYSGYNGDGTGWGHEFIRIEGATTRTLVMKAYGYVAGYAMVTYQWGGGFGAFSQPVAQEDVTDAGEIVAGLNGVFISLVSESDVDIQLYDLETGEKIVGWPDGSLNSATTCSIDYHGVVITYSGYNGDGTGWGHEFIKIEGTTNRTLVMKVYGYAPGNATVNYRWEGGGNSGTFSQQVEQNTVLDIGEIPSGIADVHIELLCDTDVDLQLWDPATGEKVVGWPDGLLNGAFESWVNYQGMTITYSGYDGDGNGSGHEYIQIKGVTTCPLFMKVYGYAAGNATVNYYWGCGGGQ